MKTRDWLVIGGVLGAAVVGVVLWEQHASASAPVTTLVTGSRYQITGPVDPSVPPGSAASSIQNSYTGSGPAGPQWQNVNVTVSGNTYTVQATYTGPGTPVPAGLTVTKIG
jgi:hypothetical protein